MDKKKLLGYRKGFVYFQIGKEVYRGDYADQEPRLRWFSSIAGMLTNILAYGLLSDENGKEIPISEVKEWR